MLGGLLDGLLGPIVKLGVGAADPTSSCKGDVDEVEPRPFLGGLLRPSIGLSKTAQRFGRAVGFLKV